MNETVFVDTNVFIYARDARDPAKHTRAIDWITRLWHDRSGRTSMQVLSEYYFSATRKLAPRVSSDDAWEDAQILLGWHPLPVDAVLLTRAREVEHRWRLSWWDAMVVAAAQLQGCAILLTEDLQDGAVYGGVTVRSPFTLDVSEPLPAYALAPAIAPRHRGRGRPRRRPPAAA